MERMSERNCGVREARNVDWIIWRDGRSPGAPIQVEGVWKRGKKRAREEFNNTLERRKRVLEIHCRYSGYGPDSSMNWKGKERSQGITIVFRRCYSASTMESSFLHGKLNLLPKRIP